MITNFQNHGDDDDDDDESDQGLGDEGSVLTIQDLLATDPSIILRNEAAVRIQTVMRRVLAKHLVMVRFTRIWQRVFDPKFEIYFWYNRLNKETQWTRPLLKLTEQFLPEDIHAAMLLQRVIRSFVGKMRVRKIAHVRFTRFYDPITSRYYFVDNQTKRTSWSASAWKSRQQIPMPVEDTLLLTSQAKIRELEDMVKKRDLEIIDIRKKRYEELEPQVMIDRVKDAKDLKRSKHMDMWSSNQLSAWFEEFKLSDYIPYIFANKMDGLLFVNLQDADWGEMKIINKIHIRKLQIMMKTYRVRYRIKKEADGNDEDDDLSEYSPSELSNMIDGEERSDDGSDFDEEEEDGDDARSLDSYDELTEEQRIERDLDDQNINIEVLVAGDDLNYPLVGDIVRVRYVCSLVEGKKVLFSTKGQMKRPFVEYALGFNQVIKGFDRALPKMSIGERSKLTFTPEYAYGKIGLFPIVPPDAEISFDLTLLGFKPRAVW
eukprot:CAMPEP_0119035170 /NCGR_PEP_ID=MMETSP1177-20130426/2125_1 /TAXON_ID=2985 /ORGANISM="Ochromonas sp, Strain CCMP1899" /LENGTH=487 /DNA_ID=CAMNT_0006993123 /DNA_START=121 /DNA_END=1581 /DNA_ORIENTATION=+